MHLTMRGPVYCRLNRMLVAAAAVLFLVCPATGAADGLERITQKLERGEPVRLAATGDSITFVCFHTDAKRNYLTFTADALRRAYPQAKIELTIAGNLGVTGTGLPKLVDAVLKKKPDLVFVMFGMNDCADGAGGLDRYDANLTQFIRQIRQAGAEPVILTQNEIVEDTLDGSRRLSLPMYMKRAVKVARREKALYVDLFADWQRLKQEKPEQWKQYLNDAIHPNVAGHRLFAAGILKKLWPEAARFQSADVRQPLPDAMRNMEPCLLAGPVDKQLLRTDPASYQLIQAKSLPRPEVLRGSYQADCELIDACLDGDGRPQYLRRDMLLNADGSSGEKGIILGRFSPQAKEYLLTMVLPNCRLARSVVLNDGSWCVVGQSGAKAPLRAAMVDRSTAQPPGVRAVQFEVGAAAGRVWLLVRPDSEVAKWTGYNLAEGRWNAATLPEALQQAHDVAVVAAADGTQQFWAVGPGGIGCYRLAESGPEPVPFVSHLPIRAPWRWEGRSEKGATDRGVLRQDNSGLVFSLTIGLLGLQATSK